MGIIQIVELLVLGLVAGVLAGMFGGSIVQTMPS